MRQAETRARRAYHEPPEQRRARPAAVDERADERARADLDDRLGGEEREDRGLRDAVVREIFGHDRHDDREQHEVDCEPERDRRDDRPAQRRPGQLRGVGLLHPNDTFTSRRL